MDSSIYDPISAFYLNFVDQALENEISLIHMAIGAIFDLAGDLSGKEVCDLACGEGYLARRLASSGAIVTGVDFSQNLLAHARQRSAGQAIRFLHDDAQALTHLADQSFDRVICNLALMDIPDLRATFQAVHRVLKKEGRFLITLLHPCFETPFHVPERLVELDEVGNFAAVRVMRYRSEGYWHSGGDGVRGRVGAYHRTLSTYINTLISCGFQLTQILEPALPPDAQAPGMQKERQVPSLLVIQAAPA